MASGHRPESFVKADRLGPAADPWLTPGAAAKYLGSSRSRIYNLIHRGHLHPTRVRGRVYIRQSRLGAYLTEQSESLSLTAASEYFDVPLHALREEVVVRRRIRATSWDERGPRLDKAATRATLRRLPRCQVEGCYRPVLGEGCGIRGHARIGQPRPDLQKYGRACETRWCEDCGTCLGTVKGYLLAAGRNHCCKACALSRRWAKPDVGLERWLDETRAHRERVRNEIERLRGEGWLTTADVATRVDRAPATVTKHVRLRHIDSVGHVFHDGALMPVGRDTVADPIWFFFTEVEAQRFETWLRAGGDWRRRQHDDLRWRSQWYQRRWRSTGFYGRYARALACQNGKQTGRPSGVSHQQSERIQGLRADGKSQNAIARIVGVSRAQVRGVLAS